VLLLNEEDVRRLLPMSECVEAMDMLFKDHGAGAAHVMPRYRISLPKGLHHTMGGMSTAFGATGLKTYVAGAGGSVRMVVLLFGLDSGEPLALVAANALGQLRTGAASGVATRYMAHADASSVAIIGSGSQAGTQLAAVCAVRPIRDASVYSRTPEKREAFAREMSNELGIAVRAVGSAAEAVRGADIVCTITSAREPVVAGDAFKPGTHINAAGSNHWMRRELDETAVRRSAVIAVDDVEQAKIEAGDLIWAYERKAFRWEQVVELGTIAAGKAPGRPNADAVTLFESQGIGSEDVAAAMHVYKKAVAQGIGRDVTV